MKSKHFLLSVIYLLVINSSFGQNGKIISKQLIHLPERAVWNSVSINGKLLTAFEYLEKLTFYQITYLSDSNEVNGYLIEPKDSGKFPVIIFNRGGNRNFAPLTLSSLINYTSRLAEAGYIIIASNYREKDEFGGAEINDVLNLTKSIEEIKKADQSKIGMFGWSRGGMMSYLALKNSDKIKTAIIGNAPTDLFHVLRTRPEFEQVFEECIPNYTNNKKAEIEKRSVIYWPEKLNKNSSLLILAGTSDQRVSYRQADRLAKKLHKLGYDFELQNHETDHFFTDKKDILNQTVIKWFDKKLKNR